MCGWGGLAANVVSASPGRGRRPQRPGAHCPRTRRQERRLAAQLHGASSALPADPYRAGAAQQPMPPPPPRPAPPCRAALQVEARSAPPGPPGPGRDMSFEEKRKLSLALSGLPHEKLTAVMEIVESDPQLAGQQVRGRVGAGSAAGRVRAGGQEGACMRAVRGEQQGAGEGPQLAGQVGAVICLGERAGVSVESGRQMVLGGRACAALMRRPARVQGGWAVGRELVSCAAPAPPAAPPAPSTTAGLSRSLSRRFEQRHHRAAPR